MSKQEEARLILELYDLRREDTMRKARDWYFREFNPQSLAEFTNEMFGAHSGYLRMVVTYWDMAAAMVNNGAISVELFTDCNQEHIPVFAKVEPLLSEIRGTYGPRFAGNIEKLIDSVPDGRKMVAATRERMKSMRAMIESRQAAAAQQS